MMNIVVKPQNENVHRHLLILEVLPRVLSLGPQQHQNLQSENPDELLVVALVHYLQRMMNYYDYL